MAALHPPSLLGVWRSTTMDGGALCVMMSLEQQRQMLLVDSLDSLDTTTMKPLVQLTHREYSYW